MELNESDEEEFGFSRNYFLAKELRGCGKKSKSTQKLSELDLADEKELREAASELVPKHEKEISLLMNNYKNLYSKWVFELRYGFGLLLYGFGSKKAVIEDFASTRLTDSGVVVINGYLQSINLKHVAATLAEVLLHNLKMKRKTSLGQSLLPFSSQSMEDLLAFLNGSHSEERHCYVCVVVHNIDGPGLREPESQQTLARIASCSLVRMVASVDHVNAPLLWDKKMVHTQFNWSWYHVPTFAPYKVEGLFFPLILASGGTTTHSAKTAVIVLESLPPNAVTAFKVLAEHQLAHPDEEGLSLNDWHPICFKRSFMSRDTLSSYLREFRDHELVKTRRHTDGQDCYYILLTSEAIEKLLQEIG